MIKLIGLKRLIILVSVASLNLLILSSYLFGVGPMLDDVTMQRDSIQAQVSETQGKLANIKADIAFIQEHLPDYKNLEKSGFFLNQDRFMIGRTMEDLRAKAGISGFSFLVADVNEITNADAGAINYKLINSHIKVDKIVSPLDTNVYTLVQEMAKVFPDFARLQRLEVVRDSEVTEQSLKDIAAGRPVNFVNAEVELDWITMVPKPSDNAGAPGSAQPAGFRGQ